MIKAAEYMRAAKEFKRIFALPLNEYTDPLLTGGKEFGFDYEKFAEEMGKHYPEVDSDGVSLSEVIKAHFGEKGVKLIERFL